MPRLTLVRVLRLPATLMLAVLVAPSLLVAQSNARARPVDAGAQLSSAAAQADFDVLRRAPNKIASFRLDSIAERGADRKRIFFTIRTPAGKQIDSSFEMIYAGGGWKPVLTMGWFGFGTTAVFGPEIDLVGPGVGHLNVPG